MADIKSVDDRDQPVGASLLAMRAYQSPLMPPDTPPSRASSLPQEIDGGHKVCGRSGPNCGSEPARDEAVTSNIYGDCQAVIASRLAPTVDRQRFVEFSRRGGNGLPGSFLENT